jgi:RNA polymerase sigma-70 factor (ECF subfamily)
VTTTSAALPGSVAFPYPAAVALEDDSDEALMAAFQRGAASAFEVLYARHRVRLFGYLRRQLGRDAGRAEELYQECWLRVIDAKERWTPQASFASYLYRIAHNLAVDHQRRARISPVTLVDPVAIAEMDAAGDPPLVDALVEAEDAARLRRAVEALPDAQREAFLLREDGGLELAEIARLTGVGVETAKSRLRYAIKALKAALERGER